MHLAAVLSVSLEWNCYVDDTRDCRPSVHVQRLDLSEYARGFSFQTSDHYTQAEGDDDMREDRHPHEGRRRGADSLRAERGHDEQREERVED